MRDSNNSNKKIIFLSVLSAVLLFLALFSWLSLSCHKSLGAVLKQVALNSFKGGYNVLLSPFVCKVSIKILLLCLGLACFFMVFVLDILFSKDYRSSPSLSRLKKIFLVVFVIICCMTNGFQVMGILGDYLPKYSNKYFTKSSDKKYVKFVTQLDAYARVCQGLLSYRYCRAEFITDLDLQEGFGMTTHRMLAYFLYPIDIRHEKPEEQINCKVIFQKDKAMDYVGKEYKALKVFNEKNIFAVRNDF